MLENKNNNNLESIPLDIEGGASSSRRKFVIWGGALMLVVALFVVRSLGSQDANPNQSADSQLESDLSTVKAVEYPDYAALSRMDRLVLAKDFSSWTPQSKVDNKQAKKLTIVRSGQLNQAYVYIKVSSQGQALAPYQSFYLKLGDSGGHIFRPDSLATPESAVTELLYPLEKISYLSSIPYDEKRQPETVNWLELLNQSDQTKLFTFISSLTASQIEDLSIYYNCIEGETCGLSIK